MARAADVDVTEVSVLQSSRSYSSNTTLNLYNNITLTGTFPGILQNKSNVTLNGNGYTVTGSSQSSQLGFQFGSDITIKILHWMVLKELKKRLSI